MIDSSKIEHTNGLTPGDIGEVDEPMQLFEEWFAEAKRLEPRDPDAMALATVNADGLPDVRMVLMKGHDERGFVFYTNQHSQKGQEIAAQPKAAFVMHWKSMNRQVRVRGPVSIVSTAEADAYFSSRPRMSQIGAWASRQSAPLESRLAFEKSVAVQTAKYALGTVPRPDYWIGYRITPLVIEFWADRAFRLHDRIEFRRASPAEPWTKTRLYP